MIDYMGRYRHKKQGGQVITKASNLTLHRLSEPRGRVVVMRPHGIDHTRHYPTNPSGHEVEPTNTPSLMAK